MNKKGFTTIELILSFIMVVVILTSLIGFTTAYRGKVNDEELKSKLFDFKNTVLKVVYDDIIRYSVVRMSNCVGDDRCVNLVSEDGSIHTLKVVTETSGVVYIDYDGTRYLLPDSNLNKAYEETNDDGESNVTVFDSACNITDFKYTNYKNRIFTVKISFRHYMIDKDYDILITIN